MTQVGKCDICRMRKVKCDEAKPGCGPCRKKNRPCTYTYGRATLFIRENPTRFSSHVGRGILPVSSSSSRSTSPHYDSDSSNDSPQGLQLTSLKELGSGHGVFQIFTLTRQRPKKERHLQSSKQRARSTPAVPTVPSHFPLENPLAARCASMFGPRTWEQDSRALFGSWMEAIPSRIGSSPVLDTAVEFVVNSFATYRDRTYSTQRAALLSRSRALKTLRQAVERYQGGPSYDLVLAIKLHSFAEIFVTAETYTWTTHCIGLSRLLNIGSTRGLDMKYHWSLMDSIYLDEVAEALFNGRPSFFDTSSNLTMTGGSALFSVACPGYQLEVVAIMHCTIQIPRLACLVRQSILQPESTHILTSALSLANSIWAHLPTNKIEHLLATQVTPITNPPAPEIGDIVADTLHFKDLKQLLLCIRYWSLLIHISALVQNLWSHFPVASASAALPDLHTVENAEIQAAKSMVRCLSYSGLFSNSLPLVPLRVLGPLALSVGPWYRLVKRQTQELETLEEDTLQYASVSEDLEKANRMMDWVIEQCNRVHDAWNVGRADRTRFETVIPWMAGEELPDWIPNKVSWEEARLQMRRQGVDR
ncbi:uncharacterized protein EI97DRAFT_381469 [Westerdykella ornata]|uniref:Zn(2)-C6 fungal-type domain-containing protein n=1 Tax=Westerdykella ornata TaxID=318751 RepID=A0A6A6JD54_WESOR|nr:uncharacterized protein EI97DRAFT_381469 [Westerdykella ornata]KAF2274362.1 hypothetical protein EI97DRAFT_381469 [Westerdykella ornata]